MLIDWITIRHPIDNFGEYLAAKIRANLGNTVHVNASGEIVWEKATPDWEAIRSDSMGLFWTVTGDADGERYLTLGASPSSLLNEGINVFGNLSVEHAAKTVLEVAALALDCILPDWSRWQCRRLDVTANYDLGSPAQVKEALSLLLKTDAPRRRTNSDNRGGDSVYWNPRSDLQAGKAYHKGAHLRMQHKKGNILLDFERMTLADNLLRLELKLGSRWFRRLEDAGCDWKRLSPNNLMELHYDFFGKLIGSADLEVKDMDNLLPALEKVAPTKGRALAAHRTWALIRTLGFTQTKESMPSRTFRDHCAILKAAGFSDADLSAGEVIAFRRKALILSEPVTAWEQIRRAA